MKLLIFLLLITIPTYATTSLNTIIISTNIPVIATINVTKTSDLIYWVHEFSNNPNGYTVILYTDVTNVTYGRLKLNASNNKIVLTQITHQDTTISTLKRLEFYKSSKINNIEIISN